MSPRRQHGNPGLPQMPLRRKPSFLRKRKRSPLALARRRRTSRSRKLVKRGRLARPRGLRPAVHFFTRQSVEVINVQGLSGGTPTGWTAQNNGSHNIAFTKRFIYNFSSVPGYSSFANMFERYKLAAVKVTIIPGTGAATGNVNHNDTAGWLGKSVPLVAYINNNRFGQVPNTFDTT